MQQEYYEEDEKDLNENIRVKAIKRVAKILSKRRYIGS